MVVEVMGRHAGWIATCAGIAGGADVILIPEEPIDLLIVRPSEDIGRIAGGYEGRLPRGLRFLVRGLGTGETKSSDLLSYLLFESPYIGRLIELGETDAERQWPEIARFLEPAPSGAPAGL